MLFVRVEHIYAFCQRSLRFSLPSPSSITNNNIKLAYLTMNPPQSTTQASSSKQPSTNDNTPPDGISGKYRFSNPQTATSLHPPMYVLSYKGCTWSAQLEEQYDGIIGVYTSLDNAQKAGTRWLRETAALHPDGSDPIEPRIVEWEFNEKTGNWEKAKALNGPEFLESRVLRIKTCEVMTSSSLPKEPKEGDGKKGKTGKEVEEKGGKA